ncbi:MAG: hypothetical protein IPK80_28595 [Nannocystis sp.]|nr:hypothetical protein [Nannocystis sp.]
MHRVAPLALALALACAHAPPPASGPQPLAGAGELRVGDGAATFRLAHEPLPDRALNLHVQLAATGASVGVVTWSLAVDGFDAVGSTTWSGEPAPGQQSDEVVRLRPRGDGVARVTSPTGSRASPTSARSLSPSSSPPKRFAPASPPTSAPPSEQRTFRRGAAQFRASRPPARNLAHGDLSGRDLHFFRPLTTAPCSRARSP